MNHKVGDLGQKGDHSFCWGRGGGSGAERKKKSISTFVLRSSEFRLSEFIEPRVKVHLLDEDYA